MEIIYVALQMWFKPGGKHKTHRHNKCKALSSKAGKCIHYRYVQSYKNTHWLFWLTDQIQSWPNHKRHCHVARGTAVWTRGENPCIITFADLCSAFSDAALVSGAVEVLSSFLSGVPACSLPRWIREGIDLWCPWGTKTDGILKFGSGKFLNAIYPHPHWRTLDWAHSGRATGPRSVTPHTCINVPHGAPNPSRSHSISSIPFTSKTPCKWQASNYVQLNQIVCMLKYQKIWC